jgi:cytochrome c
MHRPAKVAALLIAALPVLTIFGSAQAQERRGRALLREYCASCHAIGKTGRSPMQSAVPFRVLGRSFDFDEFPRLLRRGISSTHPAMPEFKFGDDDARAVTAYLRSIQR